MGVDPLQGGAARADGEIALRTDEEIAAEGIDLMEEFFRGIGMPVTLKELGIEPTEEQILELAASCARASGGVKGSAKKLTEADMAEIYRLAL